MTDEDRIRVGLLGTKLALACSDLSALILLKLIPACSDDMIAAEAFEQVRAINAGLREAVAAFDEPVVSRERLS